MSLDPGKLTPPTTPVREALTLDTVWEVYEARAGHGVFEDTG